MIKYSLRSFCILIDYKYKMYAVRINIRSFLVSVAIVFTLTELITIWDDSQSIVSLEYRLEMTE